MRVEGRGVKGGEGSRDDTMCTCLLFKVESEHVLICIHELSQ